LEQNLNFVSIPYLLGYSSGLLPCVLSLSCN
jgi:hypothetical protein